MRLFIRLAMVVLTGAMVSGAPAADWPQFLGPHRNASTTDEGKLARSWPAGGPKELWHVDLGPGFGAAAIDASGVYVLDRVPKKQEVLRCLDLNTGKELWTCAYEQPAEDVQYSGSRSTPGVDEKCVYTVGCFGDVMCVDKSTHKPLWTHNLVHDFAGKLPHWGVAQSPVLYKDLVIVAPQSGTAGGRTWLFPTASLSCATTRR
ncbi:MAG TPA: PQQ-binding-like beta-propeller repeat protein [Rhizomicrobium sp.]|nr:PQQ-binding-like beta-propeller repeat protein [Rhizomicrobium sp.]